MATFSRFYEDIEARAGEIPPEVYALLSFHGALQLSPDELSGSFLPLTGASRNPKPFIVGLLPPQETITGRLLDRSASLSRITQTPQPTETVARSQDTSTPNNPTTDIPAGAPSVSDGSDPRMNPRQLSASFWDKYVQMCNRLGTDPYELARVIFTESGFRSGIVNYVIGKDGRPTDQPQAKGFNQIIKSVGTNKAVKMTPEEWDNMENVPPEKSLEYTESYFKAANIKGAKADLIYRKNFGGYNNPDGTIYASYAKQDAYLQAKGEPGGPPYSNEARSKYFRNPASQDNSVKQNPGLDNGKGYIETNDLNRILAVLPVYMAQALDEAVARVGSDKGNEPSATSPSSSDSWAKNGSKQAAASKAERDQNADKDLNKSELGKRYMEAQRATIIALSAAVETVKNTPPLRLLVNPSSFKCSYEHKINDSDRSRKGHIPQYYALDQGKIEASGKVAAFFSKDLRGPGPGLTATAAQFSASYQNFLSLYLIYKNNGAIYIEDTEGGGSGSRDTTLSILGSVYLYYDGILYVGKFDNFSITRTEENPHSLEYSFSFSVSYEFLLDRVDPDPRRNYNIPGRLTPTTLPLPPSAPTEAELRVYQDLEEARLRQESERVQAQEKERLRLEWEAAASKRDSEIGVFTPGPPAPGTIEDQIIAKIKQAPPPSGNVTLKKKSNNLWQEAPSLAPFSRMCAPRSRLLRMPWFISTGNRRSLHVAVVVVNSTSTITSPVFLSI